MKTLLFTFCIAFCASGLMAQPVINNAEAYAIGDTLKFGHCSAIAAGAAGASQIWDFSALALTDTVKLWIIANPGGSVYSGANMAGRYSDSTYYFLSQTDTTNNVVGIIDSSASGGNDSIGYTNYMLIDKRPFTYGATVTDNYTMHTLYGAIHVTGTGSISQTGDGYGTLMLPEGTFNDVLRIRVNNQSSSDFGGAGNLYETITSYVWYNNDNKAPLLRIDSTTDSTVLLFGTPTVTHKVTVRYLINAHVSSGVPILPTGSDIIGGIDGNVITLAGTFDHSVIYSLSLHGVNGTTIVEKQAVITGDYIKIDAGRYMAQGIYIMNIAKAGNPSSKKTLKLIAK